MGIKRDDLRTAEKIERVFDSIETQIWNLVDSQTYGYANKAHADFLGLQVEEIEFKDIYSFLDKSEANVCMAGNKLIYDKKKQVDTQEWMKNANGDLRLLKIRKNPILDDKGNIEMVICMAEDITQKNQLEEEGLLKENILYSMIDFTNELLTNKDYDNALFKGISKLGEATKVDRVYYWENHLNEDDNKWYTSQRFEWTNDGVEPELDNPVMQNVSFEDVWDFVDILGRSQHFNYHVRDVENEFTKNFLSAQGILSILVLPVIIEDVFRGFIGFDSTKAEKEWSEVEISLLHSFVLLYKKSIERQILEEKVIIANNNFDNFINTVPDLLTVSDLQGNIVYANESVFNRLKYTKEELYNNPILNLHPEKYRMEVAGIVGDILVGQRNNCTLPIVSKDGEFIDVETRIEKGIWNGKDVLFAVTKDVSELKMSEEKFNKAFNNSGVSMFITTLKEGRFLEVNDTFSSIMGLSREQIIGKTSKEIKLFPDPSQREKILELIERDKSIYKREYTINSKKGSLVGQFNIVPIYVNKELCLLSSMIDMTDQIFMLEKLSRAKEMSDIANNAKSEFLAHMSHEIRTPMNAVVSYSDLLLNTELSLKQQGYARGIKSSSQMLMSMINDTLDWGKIENTGIVLDDATFNLDDIVDNVLTQIRFKSLDKKVDITIDKDANIPSILGGDPLRLQQVLLNLLSNAVKFTENGEIKITIRLKNIFYNKIELEFSVSDTGMGILEEDVKNIFEPFKQASNNISNKNAGTGLGLAISKKIVNLMGGEINVKSQIGKGSTFYFNGFFNLRNQNYHDLNKDQFVDHTKVVKEEGAKKYGSIKVLVVDDNEINQDVLREILENARMDVTVAGSGEGAIKQISYSEFDIVLMDLRMPGMDGYETTRKIRESYTINQLPIIAVTASVSFEEKEKTIRGGFNDYLIKPIDKEKLLEVIEIETNRVKTVEDKIKKEESGGRDSFYHIEGIDMEECLSNFNGNKEFLTKILKKFYHNHNNSLEEIRLALSLGDFKTASRIVHTLKGIAGEIRANKIYKLAALVENEINENGSDREVLLGRLEIKLKALFDSIKLIEEVDKSLDSEGESMDESIMEALIKRLGNLLKESDMESIDLVEILAYHSKNSKVEKEVLEIRKYCEDYNFDDALVVLEEVEKYLSEGLYEEKS